MNKAELITAVSEEAEVSKTDTKKVIDAFVKAVSNAMKNGDSVQLTGFGTFEVTERSARTGRNPQTGETVQIAACKTPKFKAGKTLKELVR